MRIIEAQTIQAIRDLFWLPEYSGTRIWPADQILEVSDCGWRTNTTKSRINVILSCLCGDGKKSPSVYQQAGEWFLSGGVPWQGRHKFPYQLHCDNWSLNLAEKKAAVRR